MKTHQLLRFLRALEAHRDAVRHAYSFVGGSSACELASSWLVVWETIRLPELVEAVRLDTTLLVIATKLCDQLKARQPSASELGALNVLLDERSHCVAEALVRAAYDPDELSATASTVQSPPAAPAQDSDLLAPSPAVPDEAIPF